MAAKEIHEPAIPESGAAIVVDSLLPGITWGEVTCPLFLTPHFRRHMVAA